MIGDQTAEVELAPSGGGQSLTIHAHDEDTWRRKAGVWKLVSSRELPSSGGEAKGGDAKGGSGTGTKPNFKTHVTEREARLYRLLTPTLAVGGYLADLNHNGVLTLFSSVGVPVLTLPPRRACSEEFQWYVDRSLTLNEKTQIGLMGTSLMDGGHRGYSARLRRDAYFVGANPDDEFNQIKFVFSDTDWE